MKISIIGVGKLGLCMGLNLERVGYEIIGVDISEDYINLLNSKKLLYNKRKFLLKKTDENGTLN